MLKLRRIGSTEIKPFPVWPPLPPKRQRADIDLIKLLNTPSNLIFQKLEESRAHPEEFDKKVMLLLACIYAHFFGYQDAPDISSIEEGHAHIIRVKQILEDEMVTHIFEFKPPDTSSFDYDQYQVADYFEELSLENHGVKHPFFDYIEHEMNAEQMKNFLFLEVIRNEIVDDEVAMLIPGLQHSMKQVVASNLWDECGNGRIDNFHTMWLVQLLSYQDQWDDFIKYREKRPWQSMYSSHSFCSLLTTPGRNYAAYGSFLISESWVAIHFDKILKGMDRLGIKDRARRIYFENHYKIDQHHRLELIEGLRQQTPVLSQKQLRDMLLGAHQAIVANKKMYDALLFHFSEKKAH